MKDTVVSPQCAVTALAVCCVCECCSVPQGELKKLCNRTAQAKNCKTACKIWEEKEDLIIIAEKRGLALIHGFFLVLVSSFL